jgi:hypothetical protein
MKKIFINIAIASAVLFVAGCEKSRDYKAGFDMINPTDALLKVIYGSAYATNPGVQLSIDDVRVSGLITFRTPFPGGGFNTPGSNFPDYLSVKPGTRKLSIAIPKKGTNVDSVLLYTTQLNLEADKNYTVTIMDTLANTKSVLSTDTIKVSAFNGIKYHFVNMMPNVPKLDLYYGTTLVATNVAYNTQGVVFTMPLPLLMAWSIRETGTSPTSTALATYSSGSTIANGRILTAFAVGYKGSAATNTRPYISFTLNK